MMDCGPYGYHERLEMCWAVNVCENKKAGAPLEILEACRKVNENWKKLQETIKIEDEMRDLNLILKFAK